MRVRTFNPLLTAGKAPWEFVEKYYLDDLKDRSSRESQWYLKRLKEVHGTSVLSLGCGPNLYDDAHFFRELPRIFVGVDINECNIEFLERSTNPLLASARGQLAGENIDVRLHVDDIRDKRWEWTSQFDTVYASGVLGMFCESDIADILDNVFGYLKPGGRLVDIDWTDCRLSQNVLAERERFEWYSTHGPSVERLAELCERRGFRARKYERYAVQHPEQYLWGTIYAYVFEKPCPQDLTVADHDKGP